MDIGEATVQTGKAGIVIAYFWVFLFSYSMNTLLGGIGSLNIIVHMMAASVVIPALCEDYFGFLLQMVAFDVLPMEDAFDNWSGTESTPDCPAFENIGYESKWAIRNLGSVAVFMAILVTIVSINLIFKCKNSCSSKVGSKICAGLVSYNLNSLLSMFHANVMLLFMSTTINLKHFSVVEYQLTNVVNYVVSCILFLGVLFLPIRNIVFLCKAISLKH